MPAVPGVINNGVISKWLSSKPSVTEMLTVDADGNVQRQAIPSVASAVWGGITGTLSAQTDLQNALDGKAPFVHGHAIGDVTNLSSTLTAIDIALAALDANKANTSSLANYLPLAGGTLTGLLRGTNISLTGNLTVTSDEWFGLGSNNSRFVPRSGGARIYAGSAMTFQQTASVTDILTDTLNARNVYLRNANNSMRLELYGTYTDASNYRRLFVSSTTAGAFSIGVEGLGTGASGNTFTIGNDLAVSGTVTATGRISSNNSDSFRLNAASAIQGGLISAGTTGFLPVQIGGGSYNSNGLLVVGDGSYLGIRNTGGLYWVTSTNPLSNAAQTGIISPSAGLVEINNGTAGQTGDLSCRAITISGDFIHKTATNNLVRLSSSSGEGLIVFGNNTNTTTAFITSTSAATNLRFSVGGNNRLDIDGSSVNVNNANLNVSGQITIGGSDRVFVGEAANTLAQRNGTTAQTLRVYQSFTDASNYHRWKVDWSGSTCRFGTERAGTGASGNMQLWQNGGSVMEFNAGGKIFLNNRELVFGTWNGGECTLWQSSAFSGQLRLVDAASSSTFNDLCLGRLIVGGAPATTTTRIKNTSGTMNFRLGNDSADCNITAAAGLFSDSIRFNGSTSSEPMLKRSSTTVQARLADDSAFGSFQGKLTTETNYTAGAPTPTGYLVLYDATGTAYRVPAVLN